MSIQRRTPQSPYKRDELSEWNDSQREEIRDAFVGMKRDEADIEKFISEAETLCSQLVTREVRSSTEIAQAIEAVEQGADALLKALANLNGDAMCRFRAAAVNLISSLDANSRLAEHWQTTVLIRDAAEQARPPKNRGKRSKDRSALQIVECVRLAWIVTWNGEAPRSRGTEFEGIAVAVGRVLGVKIGRAALAKATLYSLA